MPAAKMVATKCVVAKPKPIVPCVPDPALLFKKRPPPILRSDRLTLDGNSPDENTLVGTRTCPNTSSKSEHASDDQAPDQAPNEQACQTLHESCLQVDAGSQPGTRSISLYEEMIAGIIIFLTKVDGFCGYPLQKLRAFLWPDKGK